MKSCCVPGCNDRTSKRHRFPLDLVLFQKWMERINYPHLYSLTHDRIYRSYAVCDRHFAQEDMAPCSRTGLRRDAIPTLFLPAADLFEKPKHIRHSCKVPWCKRAAYRNCKNKIFFKFPKKTDIRQLWKKFCNIPLDFENCDNYRICEDHFQESDFIRYNRISSAAVPVDKTVAKMHHLDHDYCSSVELSVQTPHTTYRVSGPSKSSWGNSPSSCFKKKIQKRKTEAAGNEPLSAVLGRVLIDLQDNHDPQLVEGHEILNNLNLLDAKLFDITETTMPYLLPSNEIATYETLLNHMNISVPSTDFSNNTVDITEPEAGTSNLVIDDQNYDQDVNIVNYSAETLKSNEDCELLQKPYFKSVKSLLLDTNQIREVCRICFRFLMDEETIKLYEEMTKENGQQIKTMLQLALPDLDLEIYPDIVICTKCAELIEYSFHLKELWLITEKKLQKIIEKKKGTINRNVDLLIVGKTVTQPDVESVQNLDHMYAEIPTWDKQNYSGQETTDAVLKILLPALDLDTNSIYQEELKLEDSPENQPKKIVDPKGPYICEKCGRVLKWKGSLIKHLRSHANKSKKRPYKKRERKFMCEVCGQLFTTTKHLARHYRIHGDHKCPMCKKEFTHYLKLQKHISCVHLHKCDYQCHFCGKRFSYASSLRLHLISHNPQAKVLSCNICLKKFTLPTYLKKHMRKHSNEKFSCEYCGKSVRYKESLEKHILIFHLNQGQYTCDICDKPYWKKYDLKRHKIQIHGISSPVNEKVNENINSVDTDFSEILQLPIMGGVSEIVI